MQGFVPAPDRRLETPLLLLGLAATVSLLSATACWSLGIHAAWFGPAEAGIVAALLLAAGIAGVAVLTGHTGARVWLAALMALAPLCHVLLELGGHGLRYALWEDLRIALLAVGGCTIGAVGLVLRKSWARWLALAAALGGIGTGGLNIVPTLADPYVMTWVYTLSISFSAIVGLALVGPSVRAQFETTGADGVWSSPDPAVRSIRWAVLSQLVALPMLLVYAWVQPIVPDMRGPALILAAVLAVGVIACMARKLLGAIVLCLGGPALLGLAALTCALAWTQGASPQLHATTELRIAGYYACFWAPAGLISTIAGVTLARPVWRIWAQLR